MTAASVALFGTFDVENYGDLLFPHVARHLLGEGVDWRFYSPRGGQPAWADTVTAEAVFDFDGTPDMCLVGGGNILHANPSPLSAYANLFSHDSLTYASLWLGAAILAARSGARLAWNAPGVPHAVEGRWARTLRDLMIPASDYVSLRDEVSRVLLGGADKAAVVPDTVLRLAAVWPEDSLVEAARNAFLSRGQDVPERWIVFHFNDRYVGLETAACRSALAIAAAVQARPIFLALGPCHGDNRLAVRLGRHAGDGVLVVDRPAGLREMAGLIAHSAGYVGSSMHGLITALAYRKPGIAVARPRMVKFLGLLEPLGMADRLTEGWSEAEAVAPDLLRPLTSAAKTRLKAADAAIDRHGAHLRRLLAAAPDKKAAAVRAALLKAVTAPGAPGEWMALAGELTPPHLADSDARETLILSRIMRGRPHEALRRRLALARARWPSYLKLKLIEIDWLTRTGELVAARRLLARVQRQHPGNPWHTVRQVRLLAIEGDVAAARRLWQDDLVEATLPETVRMELERLTMADVGE